MIVEFECSHCKTKLRAENKIADKTASCPVCNKKITVPQGEHRVIELKKKKKSKRKMTTNLRTR